MAPGTRVLLGALVAVVLPVALALSFPPSPAAPPDFVFFLGRFHTLAVHLPIGALVLVGVAEALALFPRLRARIDPGLGLALPFLVATSVAAFALGILLARGGGYPTKLVTLHRGFTLAAVIGSAACMVAWSLRQRGDGTVRRLPYRATLGATLGLVTLGAHFGGSMTHGDTYLTRYAPSFVQRLLGAGPAPAPEALPVAPVAEPLVFTGVILPLLRERCVECHGPDKAKGGLRLDALAGLLKGGDTGAAIKPGQGAASLLVARMTLPPSDDEHMPPAGNAEPSADEIEVVRWWIDRGATEALRVRDGIASDGARAVLQKAAEGPGAPTAGAPSGSSTSSPHPPPEATATAPSSTSSSIAPAAGDVAPSGARLVYRDVVAAVLAAGCGRCHGSAEQKGKLRVDSFPSLLAGGKNGAAIVPGTPNGGTLLARMHRAVDDEKHMPPPEEPQLTAAQVGAIEWWVAQGAKETTEVSSMPARFARVGAVIASVKSAPPSTAAPPIPSATADPSETPPAATAPVAGSRVAGTVALYRDVVAPILTKRCGECHSKDRGEGGVQVDDLAKLIQGGDIVRGKPEESPILQRMRTPPHASGHMPPKTKPQPGAAEVRAVALFIAGGADAEARVDARELAEDIVSALPPGAVTPSAVPPEGPRRAEAPAGAIVRPGASGCGSCAIGAGETGTAEALGATLAGALGLAFARRRRRARRVGR